MRSHGTLIQWNDERGFGFIELAGTGERLFVHISEFPKGGRPSIGELLSFAVETRDGKKRACAVARPARPARKAAQRRPEVTRRASRLPRIVALLVLAVVGAVAYRPIMGLYRATHPAAAAREEIRLLESAPTTPTFRCDGRTHCSQMTSCAEAVYFLDNCPGVQMDGDRDGEPCERQWCY